jgi:hypothetical protein
MQLPWVTLGEDKRADIYSSIGDALIAGKKRRDDKEARAAEALRNKGIDAENVRMHDAQIANLKSESDQRKAAQERSDAKDHLAAAREIQAALDAGKNDQANLIAQAYKVKLNQEPSQAPGDTLMPMSTERPGAPTDQEVQQDAAGSAAAIAANPEMNEPGAPAANSPGLVKDLYQSRSAGRFEPQAPVAPKMGAWNIDGTKYDPEQTKAAEQATREEMAKRVQGAYAPLGENYGKMAGALALGDTGKPVDVDTLMAQRMRGDQADRERRDLLDVRLGATAQQHERENLTVEQKLSEAAKNRASRIQAAQAVGGNARQDTANLGAYKYVDQVTKDGAKELGLPKLNENLTTIDLALREMQKPSGAAQIGGRMALEKALRGGPPTQYMDQMEANHLGGIWSRLEGAIQTGVNGEMAPGQIEAIVREGEAAKEAMSAAKERRLGALRGRLQRDPALQNMRGTANERYRQIAEGMGSPAEDIFPGEDNALPAVGANSVKKPTVGDRLKSAGKKKAPGDDAAERKKRLLMELSGG